MRALPVIQPQLGRAPVPDRRPTVVPGRGPLGDGRPMWQQLLPKGVDRRPPWLTVRAPVGATAEGLRQTMRQLRLHTVCEEAHCPNLGECWSYGTATFMILGDTCTRACAFCAVHSGRPTGLDLGEPDRVAAAAKAMGLSHVVITSVDRDDLPDGGALVFAQTIRAVRQAIPGATVEVLTSDFQGDPEALRTVLDAGPQVFNHNIETVPRLFPRVRPRSQYGRSLGVLRVAKRLMPDVATKSGLMVGLGESEEEVQAVLRDLRAHDVELVTIGQYLRPSLRHIRCDRFWRPQEFLALARYGMGLGFRHVEAGPLVRSSYHAHDQVRRAQSVAG